jgi:hypothetical protein
VDGIFPNRLSRLLTSVATISMASYTTGDPDVDNAKGFPIVLRDSDKRRWNFRNHDVALASSGAARVLAVESVRIHSADVRCIVSSDVHSDWMGHYTEGS